MKKSHFTEEDITKLQHMADWMDSRFHIPGTSIKFGLDSLLGLIPGVGDTVTVFSTFYLLYVARAHKLPWYVLAKMILNSVIDWMIGLVPVIGDIFDVGWKSNQRNVKLLREYATISALAR